jgi:hypothetical protein
MPQLVDLQKKWLDAVITAQPTLIHSAIIPPPRDSVDVRIAIYTEGYLLRLIEVLSVIYPYLTQWMGEKRFAEMSKGYFNVFPSTYYAIREIGNQLPAFLQQYAEHPAYAELASLELAISRAVDLPAATFLTKEDLNIIPQERWGDVVFTLHPTVTLLTNQTNAIAIYSALIQGHEVPVPETVNRNDCRVWRKQLQIYYVAIQPEEVTFLQGLIAQETFGEICEKLCELLPEEQVVTYAINQLLRWLEDGLLMQTTLKETT